MSDRVEVNDLGPQPNTTRTWPNKCARGVGRAAQMSSRWVGDKLVAGYRALDPGFLRLFAHVPVLGLTTLAPQRHSLRPMSDDGKRLVVLMHGYAGHRGNLLPLATYLRTMGRERCISVSFNNRESVQDMARELANTVRALIEVNELEDGAVIDLVGHSMGGIVARLAVQEGDISNRVKNIVTLGTPHAGSGLARLLQTTMAKDLRPHSALLQRLEDQIPWPGPPRSPKLTALWSRQDVVLMPAESARVKGANNIEMAEFTHFSYLLHPLAWQKVFEALSPADIA